MKHLVNNLKGLNIYKGYFDEIRHLICLLYLDMSYPTHTDYTLRQLLRALKNQR